MNFSQYAGVAIVPTLSRLVLCAVFVSAGYNKVFRGLEIDQDSAARLKAMGIEPAVIKPDGTTAQRDDQSTAEVVFASLRQEEAPAQTMPDATAPTSQPSQPSPPSIPTTLPGANPIHAAPDVLPAGGLAAGNRYSARGVHFLAASLAKANMQYPRLLAWVAALTELLGGALLLIGLFSRVWGLGLSIAMGVAFYMVSIQQFHIHTIKPLDWATMANMQAFNTAGLQVALFVLAFGILLTGPGPLSIDRMLFGPSREEVEVEVVESKVERKV